MNKQALFVFALGGLYAFSAAAAEPEAAWLALGHYRPGLLGGYEGSIDSPGFYLAANGRADPEAELKASIELFAEGKRYWDLRRWKDAPVEEALDIYGLNIYLNENQAEDFHTPIPVYDLRTTFAPKMYFWPITHNELKHNKRLTQAPGWTTYD